MSQILRAQSTMIKTPDLELLRQAVGIVAQQYEDGQVKDYYLTYYGRRRIPSTHLAIFTKALHRGVGLTLDRQTKTLLFVGDPLGANDEWNTTINQLQQTYIALLSVRACQQLGWTNEVMETEEGELVIIAGGMYG